MWLSKAISKGVDAPKAEKGVVTIANQKDFEVGSSVQARNLPTYAPYGYNAVPPVGEELILVPSSDGQVALGAKSRVSSLKNGEVMITSKGGASIVLKNDGTVIINSMVISKEGVIQRDK